MDPSLHPSSGSFRSSGDLGWHGGFYRRHNSWNNTEHFLFCSPSLSPFLIFYCYLMFLDIFFWKGRCILFLLVFQLVMFWQIFCSSLFHFHTGSATFVTSRYSYVHVLPVIMKVWEFILNTGTTFIPGCLERLFWMDVYFFLYELIKRWLIFAAFRLILSYTELTESFVHPRIYSLNYIFGEHVLSLWNREIWKKK